MNDEMRGHELYMNLTVSAITVEDKITKEKLGR